MKIAVFEAEPGEKDYLRQKGADLPLQFVERPLDESFNGPGEFEIATVFVNSRVTDAVLSKLPKLRLVAARSTGFDHIDLEACKKHGVKVVNVPGYGANTVAEFAFGLLLNLTRQIYNAADQIKETGALEIRGLRGTDLKGKTIGIVGTGSIGREACRIAVGFGMRVVAHDPYPNTQLQQELNVKYLQLDELLAVADVVSLHCPYSTATHHLINTENISQFKKGAYLINTARGGLVQTEALVKGLQKGILAGVGLDVLEEEKEIQDELEFLGNNKAKPEQLKTLLQTHALMRMSNVLVTPHMAFNSNEALLRILDISLANIRAFLAGKPQNIVN